MMNLNPHASADYLPVSVLRPVGLASGESRVSEEQLVRKIRVPARTDVESPVPSLKVYPLYAPEQLAELVEAYSALDLSDEMRERHIDLLNHVQRDLRSHEVVRADASGALQGFVTIRRGIEYVSSQDGSPIVVRMIHDVLDTFENAEGVLDVITAASTVMVLSDVYHLHRSASDIAADAIGSPWDDDDFSLEGKSEEVPSVRVECHIKGRAGAQDEFVRALGETIETYSGHLGDFDEVSGMAGPAYVVGPFFPGIWFTEDQVEQRQDTHEDLRRREILRTASLIAYSDIRRVRPNGDRTILPGLRVPTLVAEYASPEVMDIASLALDPNELHPATVFGTDLSDIRMAQINVADLQDRSYCAFVGIRRTLSLILEAGFMSPLLLDIRVCHTLGSAYLDDIAERIAEIMMEQAVSDLTSLTTSLAGYEGQIQVRFRVPEHLLQAAEDVVSEDWPQARQAVPERSQGHEFLTPIVMEDKLWPHQGEPYVPTLLFRPMPSEIEVESEPLYFAVEELCNRMIDDVDAEVERIEVLRFQEDGADWIEIEELAPFACVEPFLLLRAWVKGVALPAIVSTLTMKTETLQNFRMADLVRDFAHTLGSLEYDWTMPAPMPASVTDLTDAARKIFSRSEIFVAPLYLVALATDHSYMIFGDDLGLDGREQIARCCQLAEGGDAQFAEVFLGPPSTEFMVAVRDDLRVGRREGVEAVLATFLARRVHQLLESGEGDESSALVSFLARLYVRKALGPPEVDFVEIAKAEDLIEDLGSADLSPIDPETLRAIIGSARAFTPPPNGAPIYAVTAAIAEAYENLLDELYKKPTSV
ncbi:hypothetical protein IC232_03275 [Microvirga sp. BT688]|uniref:hypothetical protein n=1 Tax=Microvirga sp. TaxID=1873136 RepID=UPI00168564D6|nr:hypothetical protein [Microvirga sp.]MBD2745710.1 hypothetical protein [Microvirga sp.]